MHEPVTLRDGAGPLAASFVPSLGMVGCSLAYDGEELLEQRGGLAAYAQRGSTFGIPLLAPWANRLRGWGYDAGGRHVELDPQSPLVHRDGATGLPIHGLLAASRLWAVTGSEPAWLGAELEFGAHPELLALFPFPHRLELTASVSGGRLSIELALTGTGSVAVPVTFGFHPYLTLPGSDRAGWELELPVRRRALLDERQLPTGDSEPIAPGALDGPLGARTFDDCFDELAPAAVFSVADARRRIELEFVRGYTVAQVYAPPASEFICFEPMTAPVAALNGGDGLRWTQPGETFTAEFAISIRSD